MSSLMLPHISIPNFLESISAKTLLDWVLYNEKAFLPSKIDYGDQGGTFRQSLSAGFDKPLRQMLKSQLQCRLPEILTALGMPDCPYRYEIEAVAYNDGNRLKRHVDTAGDRGGSGLQLRVDRRISAVYYFHRAPKSFTGGPLRLYPLLHGTPVDIEPEQNLLVAFPSFAPHEVVPVCCPSGKFADSRFTVNFWLHAPL